MDNTKTSGITDDISVKRILRSVGGLSTNDFPRFSQTNSVTAFVTCIERSRMINFGQGQHNQTSRKLNGNYTNSSNLLTVQKVSTVYILHKC